MGATQDRRKLTDKQARYLANRLSGMNGIEAHRDAYPGKHTNKQRSNHASELDMHPKIAAELQAERDREKGEAILQREEALEILTRQARIKMTDVATFEMVEVGTDKQGNPVYATSWKMKDAKDIPPDIASCIKSVTMTKSGPKIELYGSDGAISQIRAMEGWDAPKRKELSGAGGKPLALTATVDIKTPELVEAVREVLAEL